MIAKILFYTKKYIKKHAKDCENFAHNAAMPRVNSPRMRKSAYEKRRIKLDSNCISIKIKP
jgi:hypothetical protein